MYRFLTQLAERRVLVADGAMGSLLFAMGLKPGDCPEALNLSIPEMLQRVASLYLDAGADILQTNTFGGSSLKLAEYGLDNQTETINRAAVEAVRAVCGQRAFVSGSCGPSGRMLQPYGDTEPDVVFESFRRQATALIDAGVDVICVETMTDIHEATLAVRAVRDCSANVPVMATMTFNSTPRGFYTIMGVTIEKACVELKNAGANVIGSNCGNGLKNMILIAQEFRRFSSLPLIIQSNAGLPRTVDGTIIYDETPEFFEKNVGELIDASVSIIGGCCGTTPEHVRGIARGVKG
jgi:5-methyltetrahydrofolate--homocysteine methyltransferase